MLNDDDDDKIELFELSIYDFVFLIHFFLYFRRNNIYIYIIFFLSLVDSRKIKNGKKRKRKENE